MKKESSHARLKKNLNAGCCRVRAVITVDERGQMVIPKDLRNEFGIKDGDKLAVVAMGQGRDVCCLTLIKVDKLSNAIKMTLGPVIADMKNLS